MNIANTLWRAVQVGWRGGRTVPGLRKGQNRQFDSRQCRIGRECLPVDNSINTGPSEIILNKSPRLCHREMDASAQSRWLLGSGEGTGTASRVSGAAVGAISGGEGECLPADNSINTGPSEIILNKSPRLCH